MLAVPQVAGVIDRRILINYRVQPSIAAHHIPPPFRPQIVDGWAIAGICLIRLRSLRPWYLPAALGLRSENAAHRFAVEWDEDGESLVGVYIPRRDSSSRFNALAGGRLFPGLHHYARVDVRETETGWSVRFTDGAGANLVSVDAELTDAIPTTSVFPDLAAAARFFAGGSRGFSPSRCPTCFDGLELQAAPTTLEPLSVVDVQSAFFDDRTAFPEGTVEFDSAFLMRNVRHRWVSLARLRGGDRAAFAASPA